MKKLVVLAAAVIGLVACDVETTSAPQPSPSAQPLPKVTRTGRPQNSSDFWVVVRRVEPVAERYCRQMRPSSNCDFDIGIDDRFGPAPNALQTYDKNGRPILRFNTALLRKMRNRDEIGFALSHEAAHHIRAHISQTQRNAAIGSLITGAFASAIGADAQTVDSVSRIGGTVGARRFSKSFELEADSLGARIAERAGYDALRGVLYFQDARDPGDRFLGTHPPNADRIRIVRNTVQ